MMSVWAVGRPSPGAVSLSSEVVDEFVLLRFAEMLFNEKPRLLERLDFALKHNNNFGANALRENFTDMLQVIESYGREV